MQIQREPPEKEVKSVVTALRVGHHGRYFMAESDIGMITVSLNKPVWQEEDEPDGGITVIISDIRWKRKGWRGYSARFLRPGDEELPKKEDQNSKEGNMAQTEEDRSKRKETQIKWGIGLGVAFVAAPYVYIAIGGMIGLAIAAGVGFTIIQFSPVVAMKIANRKIKMIVDEAQQNPIETMQNLRIEREKELDVKHQEIVDFETEIRNFNDEVVDFKDKYPAEALTYESMSKTMERGLDDMKGKHEQAEKGLEILIEAIAKAEAIYKMAQAAERVTKLSKSVEQLVFADIKQKVAFDSVRSQVNRSFAALNNSVGQRRELRSQATFALPGVGSANQEVAS